MFTRTCGLLVVSLRERKNKIRFFRFFLAESGWWAVNPTVKACLACAIRRRTMSRNETEQSRWFEEAVCPHEAGLRRWIKARFSGIREEDDLVQEAFARILKAYRSGPVPNPQAYLFVVTRNLAINRLQRMNLEHPPEAIEVDPHVLVDEMSGPYESAALQDEIDDLVCAFQALPERCRQVMTLRKIYGLSQKEIAAKLDITEHTVEAQVGIGLRKCRSFFRQRGYSNRFRK